MIRPDSEIVKTAGDDDLLPLLVVAVAQGKAEVNHAVDVVPVSRVVIPDLGLPLLQDFFEQRKAFFYGHRSLFTNSGADTLMRALPDATLSRIIRASSEPGA